MTRRVSSRAAGSRRAVAAVVSGVVLILTPGLVASAAGQARPAAVAAPGAEAVLPLKRVILYRSGVGYFERTGTVRGDSTAMLRFEEGQINDILKSMVLLDLDPGAGGKVGGVMYGSKEPLERRLRSFGIDLSEYPDVMELFAQLRGTQVSIETAERRIEGTIFGVENRSQFTSRQPNEVHHEAFVTLVVPEGIRAVSIQDIVSFQIADPSLREELNQALAAIAESRADDTKTVEVRYTGPQDRERRVAIGYVHETPVWKTTYRLILPDDADAGSQAPNGGGKLRVQGMAIVENTTDQDWENIRLSLASGRPVGFVMPLYDPVYMQRPIVPVPGIAAVAAKVFEQEMRGRAEGYVAAPSAADMAANAVARQFAYSRESGGGGSLFEDSGDDGGPVDLSTQPVNTAASAGEVGEQFMYTLDTPVTLERQRSAMLPILDSTISGRRVSIYSAGDGRPNPMRGAELKNDSGLHLMPGPVSVFDGDSYAGDAQVPHTGRNSTQLLAYAIDLDVQAQTKPEMTRETRQIRIVDGALEETIAQVSRTTYSFDNRDAARARTILVEHPKMPGWDLITPKKADQETESLYRFELALGKGESGSVEVEQQMVIRQTHGITSYPLETLMLQAQRGKASPKVVEAFRKAGELQGAVRDLDRQISDTEKKRSDISQDQDRIRRNMGSIDRTSDLYRRYMANLTEQEGQMESMWQALEQLRQGRESAQAAFDSFVRGLEVE